MHVVLLTAEHHYSILTIDFPRLFTENSRVFNIHRTSTPSQSARPLQNKKAVLWQETAR